MNHTGTTDKARGLVRTYLWLVVLATCVAVGAAVAAAAAKPITYTATAEVLVSPEQTKTTALVPDMGTERAIAQSGIVVQRTAEALKTDEATVRAHQSVSIGLETRVLHISYTASTPEAAFRGAGALAASYVDYRNSQGQDRVASLVTAPSIPYSGSRGSLPLYLGLGLVAGLTVGIAAAWLWDRASDRFRSGAELRQLTGLPILVRLRQWNSRRSLLPSAGSAREAFAFLAARLTSMTGQGAGRTIVITGPRAGAGSTTVACGTAAALAAQGKRVVLIAANPTGLRPEELVAAKTSPRFGQVLSRGTSPELALHPTEVPHLSVLLSKDAPGATLAPQDVRLVQERLESRAIVVIDAPPVLTSADSLLLADVADLVVLVGDLRSGTRSDVREALALLDGAGPKLAGWVMNLPPRRRRRRRPTPPQASTSASPGPADRVAERTEAADETVTSPAGREPDRAGEGPGRPVQVAMKARPQPGRNSPDAPRTETPARGGVRPDRAPGAAAPRP